MRCLISNYCLILALFCAVPMRAHAQSQAQPSDVALRYRDARRLENEHHVEEALAIYRSLGPGLPRGVQDDVKSRKAVLLAKLFRCSEAKPYLSERAHPTRAERLALIGCAKHQHDLAGAEAALRAAIDGGQDDYEMRADLADVQIVRHENANAADTLLAMWLRYPGPKHDVRTRALIRRAHIPWHPTADQIFTRAEKLIAIHEPKQAVLELRALPRAASHAQRAHILHEIGMALYATRHDYEEASRVLGEAAQMGGDFACADALHRARAIARLDRDAEAVTELDRVVQRYPNDSNAVFAEAFAARLALHLNAEDGIRRYQNFLNGPRSARDSDLHKEARFELAMGLYDAARFAQAAEAFTRFADIEDSAHARGAYWAGRAYEKAGEAYRAQTSYRAAVEAEPLLWYALLAHERLHLAGIETLPFVDEAAVAAPAPISPTMPEEAAFYAQIAFFDDAVRALHHVEDAVIHSVPQGRGDEALAMLYAQLGAFHKAYEIAVRTRGTFHHAPNPQTAWAWKAAYPRAWNEAVEAGTHRYDLPEDYLYGIMRQESAYDPTVVSSADAIGLLQLLPNTARMVAAGEHERAERQDLFVPETNIHLGARYSGTLYRLFGGMAQLSIASYNAGESRVRKWTQTLGTNDLDLFVERIPIDQTRNYVRRVTGHWARYAYLRTQNNAWPIALTMTIDPSRFEAARANPP